MCHMLIFVIIIFPTHFLNFLKSSLHPITIKLLHPITIKLLHPITIKLLHPITIKLLHPITIKVRGLILFTVSCVFQTISR